ncbi:hypothetical protein MBLNU230_g2654t1 [Neophaeotheca triangularis]
MSTTTQLISQHRPDLAQYEELYKHFHANPELSNQEKDTAATLVRRLHALSPDLNIRSNIGGYGIAAVLHNGPGQTILLRADFDALPVEERTGLPYASTKRMVDSDGVEKPVMHACGHDMHITCLLAAAETLVSAKEAWSGSLVFIFQPAEEKGTGARAMVDDGLYKRHGVPIPDAAVGAHVMPLRAGMIGTKRGTVAGSSDSMRVTLHGRGGHASMPDRLIDPVVMAASTVKKLQTIVSREVASEDSAVVTVASIQAGDAENIVSDDARLAINVRAINARTRQKVLESIKRIAKAEALAGNAVAEPTFVNTSSLPLTINDDAVTGKLETAFRSHFTEAPHAFRTDLPRMGGSEDFSVLGTSVDRPVSFFAYGGTDPEFWDTCGRQGTMNKVPVNHSALFAPIIMPTLRTGVDGYVAAALAFLAK